MAPLFRLQDMAPCGEAFLPTRHSGALLSYHHLRSEREDGTGHCIPAANAPGGVGRVDGTGSQDGTRALRPISPRLPRCVQTGSTGTGEAGWPALADLPDLPHLLELGLPEQWAGRGRESVDYPIFPRLERLTNLGVTSPGHPVLEARRESHRVRIPLRCTPSSRGPPSYAATARRCAAHPVAWQSSAFCTRMLVDLRDSPARSCDLCGRTSKE